MFKNFYCNLSNANDWYHTLKKEIKLASGITINNKLLSEELELACNKQHGVLTYAEYLLIDQFGKNGYYATSNRHGKTDVETRWGHALANYCEVFGYNSIIEVGCGTGELGVATIRAVKRQPNIPFTWTGVEIDTNIHKKIFDNFKKHKEENSIKRIVSTLNELPSEENALIIFPYSLDCIPPQIFLNTESKTSYPNALLGISVKDGRLSEIIIPSEILHKKGIKLEKGFFTQNGYTYKLTSWKLRKGQRAYISTDLFITIYEYAKKFKSATIIIIDEFRNQPWYFNLGNLGTGKSLYEKNLLLSEKTRYYRESGKHNSYFPLYKNTLVQFLNSIGFGSIGYDIEQKKAAELGGKLWIPLRENYWTLAFFAKHFVDKKIDIVPIPFTTRRIV